MSQQEPEAVADSPTELEPVHPPETDSRAKLRALEAVLFMAAEPLSREELAGILEVTPKEAEGLAQQLEARYGDGGLQVVRIAGGYQVATRPEYGPQVARLHKPERFRLSRAALETLAIVAYRQPVTRPEIEAIRGVNSDSAVDTLAQYELIREAGRKEAPGRPMLYCTTDQFLGHFGLDSIEDLPQLEAIPVGSPQVQAEDAQASQPQGDEEEETELGAGETEEQPEE
jgi:segregation and condensation protein B